MLVSDGQSERARARQARARATTLALWLTRRKKKIENKKEENKIKILEKKLSKYYQKCPRQRLQLPMSYRTTGVHVGNFRPSLAEWTQLT